MDLDLSKEKPWVRAAFWVLTVASAAGTVLFGVLWLTGKEPDLGPVVGMGALGTVGFCAAGIRHWGPLALMTLGWLVLLAYIAVVGKGPSGLGIGIGVFLVVALIDNIRRDRTRRAATAARPDTTKADS